jgi:hypothetical protein
VKRKQPRKRQQQAAVQLEETTVDAVMQETKQTSQKAAMHAALVALRAENAYLRKINGAMGQLLLALMETQQERATAVLRNMAKARAKRWTRRKEVSK